LVEYLQNLKAPRTSYTVSGGKTRFGGIPEGVSG
jgi:hypothetical protein